MIHARGAIKDGAFKLLHRAAFDEAVGHLPDGPYVLSLEDEKEYRSSSANRFYWGAIVASFCKKFEGHTKEEIHEILKYKFNRRTVADPVTGEVIEVGMTTTTMTQAEFAMYSDACVRYGAEIGVDVVDTDTMY